jgi:hypothetical protein
MKQRSVLQKKSVVCAGTLLTAILVGQFTFVNARQYQVAQDGSGDFRTIQAAADVAVAGDVVVLHKGIYRETVVPKASGAAGNPIVFRANIGEPVVVNGCDVVSGWTVHSGKIYKAPMSWTMGVGKDEVFVDGKVVIEARFPNTHKARPSPRTWETGYNMQHDSLRGRLCPLWPTQGDFTSAANVCSYTLQSPLLTQPTDFWKGAMYVSNHKHGWTMATGVVQSSTQGSITVGQASSKWWMACNLPSNPIDKDWGYITGVMGALDTTGEWVLQSSQLYLWPPKSDNPMGHFVEAKRRQLGFDFAGLSYIQVKGIIVFASSATLDKARYCTFDSCHFAYPSHYTLMANARQLYLDGTGAARRLRGETGLYFGGANCAIKNWSVRYSPGPGITMSGLNDTVENCLVDETDYMGSYPSGICFIADPAGAINTPRGGFYITRNTIKNSGRYLITYVSNEDAGWCPEPWLKNTITYNNLWNGVIITHDGGLYGDNAYINLGGTEFAYNAVHDRYDPESYGAMDYCDTRCGGGRSNDHDNLLWASPLTNNNPLIFWECVTTGDRQYPSHVGGLATFTDAQYPGAKKFSVGHDWGVPPEYNPSGTSTAVVRNISRVRTAGVTIAGNRLSLPAGAGKARVEILRGDGRRMVEAMTVDCSDRNIVVPLDRLAAGMCVVRISGQGGEIVRRLPVVR